MYGKNKGSVVPSDAQSKEKLAVYVYEYLVHVGAQKTASSFLQEIRWDKPISVGEPPGFLHSWWNVFWDLYSAAPERRDTHDHSSEAKAFHDYGFVSSGYPNGISHPTHPVMSAPGGVGGPGMPPPLGPPVPDPGMRPRPSGPSMMPGAVGLPPGAAPGPHHPSLRFHQAGGPAAGAYSGLPVSGGLIPPPHANLIPGGAGPSVHPIHGGPMLPHHHHPPPPGSMLGHTRPRWMGPSVQPPQPGGPSQASGGPPVVCSGSMGSNSNSSTGPGSIGPGSCGGGGGSGIVPSPGHPGTPTQHPPNAPSQQQSQHLAVPSPLNNQPSDHQSVGNLPPGHPGHHTAGHYMVGQPPQQQTPPASSSGACLPPEYSTRPSPHLVFNAGSGSGGPGSAPDSGMYSANEATLLNGAGSSGSNSSGSGGGVGGCSGGPPSRGSGSSTGGGMLPPPPPDYSTGGGMPVAASGYPGSELKASPLHSGGGAMSSADLMGLSGGPQLLPPDYPPGGNGTGGSFCPAGGPGAPPESVMMMPPPLPSHQQHMVNVTTCQNAPPPPQYVSSSGPHSVSSSATVSAPPSLQSIVSGVSNPSPAGGPGSVQFPQEYSFSQLS